MGFIDLRSPDGNWRLQLCPEVGGGITEFSYRGVPLFRRFEGELSPLNFSSFPLTPYSNRIDHGKLHFRGQTLEVGPPFREEPHPNHGNGWTSPWQVARQESGAANLTLRAEKGPRMPYAYQARQDFKLTDDGLTIDLSVTNHAGRALPYGIGHHPYFPRTDKTILKTKARKVWTSRNMMPVDLIDVPPEWDFSQGAPLSPAQLDPPRAGADGSAWIDHCFAGWDRRAEITWPEHNLTLVMEADPVFGHFVVFIPAGGDFFCAEPVSHATDGFNLAERGVRDNGTVVLEDGATLEGAVRFTVLAH